MKATQTAERPSVLEADVKARYFFAKKYTKGKKVLDVGCGFGLGSRYLAEEGAKKVLGADYNPDVIKIAKRNKLKNLEFEVHNALALDKIKQKFNVILAFEIIEHLPPEKVGVFIYFLYQLLEPGGILLLTTPNKIMSKSYLGRPYNPYHTKEYTGQELSKLFDKYFDNTKILGFSCVNKSYIKKQNELTSTLIFQFSFHLGHYRIVRELLGYIDKSVKRSITGENNLPKLDQNDYRLDKDFKKGGGLFLFAEKVINEKSLPKVDVVIASYNGEHFLPKCITSLSKTNYPNFRIVICDDNSTDKSIEVIKNFQKRYKNITLVKNPKNLGAAATRNRATIQVKSDIVVFLDNDTEVTRSWLMELVTPLVRDKTVGATQAVFLDMLDKSLVQQAGAHLMPQTAWSSPFFQWKNYAKVKAQIKEREIIGVSGALAVRSSIFNLIGGFDEQEARLTEDIDFSWRIWTAGYRILLAPSSLVYHFVKPAKERTQINENFYRIYFHLIRNSFRSITKNYQIKNVFKYLPITLLINYGRGILVLFRRGEKSAILATFAATAWMINNWDNTMKERSIIEKNRFFSDDFIYEHVFDKRDLVTIYKESFIQTKLI